MLAARYVPGQKALSIQCIEVPTPGPDEVLLKVRAAGICHSDLFCLEAGLMQTSFTMGHEICGSVVSQGERVAESFDPSSLYAVHGPNPCGACASCRSGNDNLCNDPGRQHIGLGEDGGYAEFVKVRARNIVRVPDGIRPEVAAVATDAVLTPYHAIKTVAEVGPGTKVLLIGLGGLGLNGLQIALALGADVTACDVKESSLEAARAVGARVVLNSKELDEKLEKASFDVVLDFVGIEPTFAQAQSFVRPNGTIVLIGVGNGKVSLSSAAMITFQIRVLGTFWGTHAELEAVFELIASGKVRPSVETGDLKDVNQWLEELHAGRIKSRMALIP